MPTTTDFCTIDAMKPIEIGRSIATHRVAARISQSELARRLDIKPQAVQKWEKGGGKPRPSRLGQIADALSISVKVLVKDTVYEYIGDTSTADLHLVAANERLPSKRETNTENERTPSTGRLPLISWAQAGMWADLMKSFPAAQAQDWIEVPYNHGKNSFCLTVEGESMFDPAGPKSYAPGDVIAVDPTKTPRNRSTVVIRFIDAEEAVLRQILMDGQTMMLRTLNPNWPNGLMSMPDTAEVIGVVVGKWVPE